MEIYEYKVKYLEDDDIDDIKDVENILDKKAEEGWEFYTASDELLFFRRIKN